MRSTVITLCLAILLMGGCGMTEETRVDASTFRTSAKTLYSVFQDIAADLIQGKVDPSKLRQVTPELLESGLKVNFYLLGLIKDAAMGEPIPDHGKEVIQALAKKFDGLSAQEIIERAKGPTKTSGTGIDLHEKAMKLFDKYAGQIKRSVQ